MFLCKNSERLKAKFPKFLSTPFFTEYLQWLLLIFKTVVKYPLFIALTALFD